MKTIDYLKTFPNLEEGLKSLTETRGIKVKEYGDLILLNYCQIESPKSDDICIECRSLIIDKELNVISRSFDRFFNLGEMEEYHSDFNWNDITVYEKADGSLIKVYWNPYAEQFEISTRGSAFAEVEHQAGGIFREWVLKAFGVSEDKFQENMAWFFTEFDRATDESYPTLVFEYTGPENRIVTRYSKSEMVLLSIIGTSGKEHLDTSQTDLELLLGLNFNVRLPKVYTAHNPQQIIDMSKELPTLEEGYVVRDSNGKRIKVKNPAYVVVHHMRGNGAPTPKNISSLVIQNEHDEYLSYYPEEKDLFFPYIDTWEGILIEIHNAYDANKDIESQKDFALQVKDYPYSAILFSARKLNKPIAEILEESRIDYRIDLLLEKIII